MGGRVSDLVAFNSETFNLGVAQMEGLFLKERQSHSPMLSSPTISADKYPNPYIPIAASIAHLPGQTLRQYMDLTQDLFIIK